MGIREFLRGGVYSVNAPVTVMNHNTEMGLWIPRGQYETAIGVGGAYYVSSTPTASITSPDITSLSSSPLVGSLLRSSNTSSPDLNNIRDAVAMLHAYLNPQEEPSGKEEG